MPVIRKESNISSSSGGLVGTWNASTNTPALSNTDTGKLGIMYQVSTGGSVDFGAGSITFEAKDIVINNGTTWDRIDSTDAVLSVASKTGVVTLDKTDVGLSNVDNTSDTSKPVSTATQSALDLKSNEITIVSKSSAYSLTNTDIDKQFQVTGTTTITLPNSLTWATNQGCEVVNIGAGTVTIALGGSVSVNGATTSITLDPYKGVVLQKLSTNVYLGIGV